MTCNDASLFRLQRHWLQTNTYHKFSITSVKLFKATETTSKQPKGVVSEEVNCRFYWVLEMTVTLTGI